MSREGDVDHPGCTARGGANGIGRRDHCFRRVHLGIGEPCTDLLFELVETTSVVAFFLVGKITKDRGEIVEKTLWRESLQELANPVLIWYIVLFCGFWFMLYMIWEDRKSVV